MDFQNYSNIQNNPNQFNNKRNTAMEAAAFILSIISVSTCTCIYVSIVCGALALALEKNPKLKPVELKLLLYDSVSEKIKNLSPAWGILNVDNLIKML